MALYRKGLSADSVANCQVPDRRLSICLKMHQKCKCGKMLPPLEETDVFWCCSLVGWDLLLFPIVALLPSAFDVGFISSMLNESYKSQEVTTTPRNELRCIICLVLVHYYKGYVQLSKDLLFILCSQIFGRGKGLRVGRGCSCSCVIGMSPAGAQGMQKRGRLCFQITFIFIFLLVLIYIFFPLVLHRLMNTKEKCMQ